LISASWRTLKLNAGQKALAAVFLELLDPAGRVHAFGNKAAPLCERIHAADNGQDAVGLERRRLELPVQPRDLRSCYLIRLRGAELRRDNLVKQMPIEGDGSGLALLLDMLGHEPVGQSGDRERAAFGGLLSRRVLTMRHRSQDGLCPPSGGLRCRLADVRDSEAPDRRAAPGARPIDHDVGHGAARPHTDAEAGQLGVPDRELPCLRPQSVNNALGDPLVGHGCPVALARNSSGETPGKHRKGNSGKLAEVGYAEKCLIQADF
jgi:hypothetical protein